jgi:hypothetical protein
MTERRYIPEIERKAIHYAWNHKCAYCRCDVPYDDLHIDHVVPVSSGGSCNILNLVSSCSTCNLTKNDTRLIDMYEGLILSRARDKEPRVKKYLSAKVKCNIKDKKFSFFCVQSVFMYCGFKGELSTYKANHKELSFMEYVRDNIKYDKEMDRHTVRLPLSTELDVSTFSGSVLEIQEYNNKNNKPKMVSVSSPITGYKTYKKEHLLNVNKDTFDIMYEVLANAEH